MAVRRELEVPYPSQIDELRDHNVQAQSVTGGQGFSIGSGVKITWRAEGKDTGYTFSCYEVELAPDQGIPLHKHPYAEFFFVIEGEVSFQKYGDEGTKEWITCGPGASVLAPPNAPHAFHNRSAAHVRFIATSTYNHEIMLKESKVPGGVLRDGYSNPTSEGFLQLLKSQERDQVFYLED